MPSPYSRYMIGVPYWLKKALTIAGAHENLSPGVFAAKLIIKALIAEGYSHLVPEHLLTAHDEAANADEAQAA